MLRVMGTGTSRHLVQYGHFVQVFEQEGFCVKTLKILVRSDRTEQVFLGVFMG